MEIIFKNGRAYSNGTEIEPKLFFTDAALQLISLEICEVKPHECKSMEDLVYFISKDCDDIVEGLLFQSLEPDKKCQVLTPSIEDDYELYDYYDGEVAYSTIEEAKEIIKEKK